MTVLLSLLSALAYGTSDFLGGLVSSRISPWTSAFTSQCGGALVVLVLSILGGGDPTSADLGWGAVSGTGTAMGVVFLYRGLGRGRMGVVAPVAGLASALLPVIVGVATGDRPVPVVWTGILLALPAIFLVARIPASESESRQSTGILDGVLAGCGFGSGFAAIAQAGKPAGHWPLVVGLVVGAALVALAAVLARQQWIPRRPLALLSACGGALSGVALALFVAATQHGLLAVSGVVSSLYPAATIVLAVAVLRERIHRGQAVGLALCVVAVGLVAASG